MERYNYFVSASQKKQQCNIFNEKLAIFSLHTVKNSTKYPTQNSLVCFTHKTFCQKLYLDHNKNLALCFPGFRNCIQQSGKYFETSIYTHIQTENSIAAIVLGYLFPCTCSTLPRSGLRVRHLPPLLIDLYASNRKKDTVFFCFYCVYNYRLL